MKILYANSRSSTYTEPCSSHKQNHASTTRWELASLFSLPFTLLNFSPNYSNALPWREFGISRFLEVVLIDSWSSQPAGSSICFPISWSSSFRFFLCAGCNFDLKRSSGLFSPWLLVPCKLLLAIHPGVVFEADFDVLVRPFSVLLDMPSGSSSYPFLIRRITSLSSSYSRKSTLRYFQTLPNITRIVEVTIGVICICLPPLGALFINRRTPHTTTTNYSGHIQPRSQQRASPINIVTPTATRRSRTSIGLREGEAFTRAEYMALNSPTELNQPQENYFNTRNDDEIAPVPLPASAPSHGNSRCPSVVVSPPDVDLPAAPGPSYQPFRHSDTFQPQMPGNLRRVKSDSRAEKEKTVKHFASFSWNRWGLKPLQMISGSRGGCPLFALFFCGLVRFVSRLSSF